MKRVERALPAALLAVALLLVTSSVASARVLSRDELARLPLIPVDPAAPLPAGEPPARALRKAAPVHPRLSPQLDRLAFELARTPGAAARSALAERLGVSMEGGEVKVVVHLADGAVIGEPGVRVTVGGVSLRLEARRGRRLEAWVAAADLPRLAGATGIERVEAALRPQLFEVISKGVATMKADKLQALGVDGSGVVIGVVDAGFLGYEQLLGSELPSQVITRSFGTDITGGGENHGTAVAETVHDVAPGATLALVAYGSTFDFEDAVDWLVDNGAQIITTSTGSSLTGPCDGRDAMAAAANAAVDRGAIFLASAGNYGDGHYLATFTPSAKPGFEGYHAFTPVRTVAFFGLGNNCYGLGAGTEIDVSLTWDDWGPDPLGTASRADYDLYLMRYDQADGWQFSGVASDLNQQQGWYPWEMLHVAVPQDGCYGLAVRQTAATRAHELHLYAYSLTFANPFVVPERSVIDPCVGEKVQCIGATSIYDTLAQYSSQGPANPDELTGRVLMKPDFAAPAGTQTVSLGGFAGTSASAPHAAGAMALFLQLTGYDRDAALGLARGLARDLGPAGQDPRFGWGRLELGTCTPAYCDDHLACTVSTCQPWTGCQQTPTGDGCVLDDACHEAGATHPTDPCRVCDPLAPQAWSTAPDGAPCDDGNACTAGDACQGGTCVPGAPVPQGTAEAACAALTCDGTAEPPVATFVEAGTPCGAAAGCVDGAVTPVSLCDGQGACVGDAPVPCAPYAGCAEAGACASGCTDDAGCVPSHRCAGGACVANQAPLADAGAPQAVGPGATATLDAGASSDPEGDALDYAWTQTSGAHVVLDDAASATPSFVAPSPVAATTLRFVVTVYDGRAWSPPATTTVVVGPLPDQAPVADAGSDLEADAGAPVTLDGSGSIDPDGTAFTFAWSQLAGPAVTLDDPAAKQPTFTAPTVDVDTDLAFALVVSDGVLQSPTDEVTVRVRALPGPEPEAAEGTDATEAGPADDADAVDGHLDAGTDPSPEASVDALAEARAEAESTTSSGGGCALTGARPGTSGPGLAGLFALLAAALWRRVRRGRRALVRRA
jgi:hypothetical protein